MDDQLINKKGRFFTFLDSIECQILISKIFAFYDFRLIGITKIVKRVGWRQKRVQKI